MKKANINITAPYKVTVIPTELRYSLKRELFEVEGKKVCEISYEILANKYVKMIPKLDAEGQPVLKSGKPVLEESIVDFTSPVLFDTGSKVIPFDLYLLIETQRAFPNDTALAAINSALQNFNFEGSLSDFKLSVTDVN